MKKIAIKIKSSSQVDLRQYNTSSSQSSGKNVILNVMSQLIEHTESLVNSSVGDEKKKNQFRVAQFKKAIGSLRSCPTEITSGKQAKELPGIGKGIADRIDEILRTGTLSELHQVKKFDAKDIIIQELMNVTGIGEANAKKFIEMGVTSVQDLQEKVTKGLIKITHHMQIGLKYYHDIQQKIPFSEIADLGSVMRKRVNEMYPDMIIEICGSHRRQKPLSGDIDVLMTSHLIVTENDLIQSQVHYLKDIVKSLKATGFIVDDLTSQGDTKYMGVCVHPNSKIGRRIDIRFVTYDSFYPAILYFTGSMMLNKLMRTVALEKGYTLNEYGLYKVITGEREERIVVHSEKEIFDILNLVYLEPQEREIV